MDFAEILCLKLLSNRMRTGFIWFESFELGVGQEHGKARLYGKYYACVSLHDEI